MSERKSRQVGTVVNDRLLRVNMKRILYVSACTAVILPIILIIYKFLPIDESLGKTVTGFLIAYELLSVASIIGLILMKKFKVKGFERIVVRAFWGVFLGFSFVMMYADTMSGNGISYYGITLAVLSFVPLLGTVEMMYYYVVQAVFAIFLMIRFGMSGKGVADIVVMNLLFFVLSRVAYKFQAEYYRMKEKAKSDRKGVNIDPMTGLLNRIGFENEALNLTAPAIKGHKRISVLMIDVDDLKNYNSEFGADQGDRTIKTIAETIRKISARFTDVVSRVSGGTFMVMMVGGGESDAVVLAEKLRGCVEKLHVPARYGKTDRFVTVSVGVSSDVIRSRREFSDLCNEAENALTGAKRHGKNTVVFDEQIYGRRAM